VGGGSRLLAQFTPPRRVTAPGKATSTYHLGLDYFEHLVIAHEDAGELAVESFAATELVDSAPLGKGTEPSLAFSVLGSYISYCAAPANSAGDLKVFLRSRLSGPWSDPKPVSEGAGDDHRPCLQVTSLGRPVIAWERRTAGAPTEVWFRRGTDLPVKIGPGEAPALVLGDANRAYVFFLRGGDVYTTKESSQSPGFFPPATKITNLPGRTRFPPRAGVLGKRAVFLCFERDGRIFLANDRLGDFVDPVAIDDGLVGGAGGDGSAQPAFTISANGAVGFALEKGRDVYTTLGATFFVPPATPAFVTPESETSPAVAVDSFANVYLGFLRSGILYFANNAGLPQAQFEATPRSGEAPLEVSFRDESIGDVTGWLWDFADGTTSAERHPLHVFAESGAYKVRLRVSGPGGQSPIEYEELVLVSDARNVMRLGDVAAFPGQRDVYVPVIATHDRAAQGLTLAATYDPAVLEVRDVVYDETNISSYKPELFAVNISDDPAEPFVTTGVLFDVLEPFDGRVFPAGLGQRVANIIVDVSQDAVQGTSTRIELTNQVGRPPLNNIFTVDGFSILPQLEEGGTVEIRQLHFPPPRFFRRGDSDSNGVINLTDAITTLSYLFAGGPPPGCYDAADVVDDGKLDITDATFLLSFLFKSGSYPPAPYPDWGLDPTEDELPECLLR
jgi:PKD repeat protein